MRQRHIPEEQNSADVTGRASLLSEEARVEEQTTTPTVPIQKAESGEDLAGRLSQEVKAHQKVLASGAIGLTGFCGLTMVLFDSIGWGWLLGIGFWIFLLVVVGTTASLIYSALKPRKRRRGMASMLAKQEDMRSVGALIDLLGSDDGKMHDITMDALIRLLPRLKASDASLLTGEQRTRLCLVLTLPFGNPLVNNIGSVFRRADDRDVEFRIAILTALAQIGDGSALPIVIRLANGKAKREGQRRIQEAARDCLPALQQLVQQEGHRQTLLRAAAPSDAAPDTLLRAATGATSTAPDQLLRSSQSGS
jgi:hypothetical protein